MPETTETAGQIVKDDELKTLSDVVKKLNALDAAGRARVVAYILARYTAGTAASGVG